MNLDVLKIDQSFIRQTKLDDKSKSILKTIIALGTDLGMTCVAEGIETKEIADVLIKLGCSHGQGYLFGRPQNLDYYLNPSVPLKKAA
jgi:EAL domain-containing protein (putative c-di-GMP-specific phosphodiesterase class I)